MVFITPFNEWVRQRRRALDMTQAELAARVGCAAVTIKKIEQARRRPSRQMAELLAEALAIPTAERESFLRLARHEYVAPGKTTSAPDEAPQAAGDRLLAMVAEGARPASFVGRDAEIARLDGHLVGALNGSGRLVLVSGEAGYGKTTLLTEFARYALERYPSLIVVGGNCESLVGAGTPYLLFRDILAQLTCNLETPGQSFLFSREQARRLWSFLPFVAQRLLDDGPELIDVLVSGARLRERVLAHPFAAGQSQVLLDALAEQAAPPREATKHKLFSQYSQLLRALAERRPLLLLLDDLQWIDHASANLLAYVISRLAGCRLLFLGSYRSSEVHPGDLIGPGQAVAPAHVLTPLLQDLRRRFGDIEISLDQATPQLGRAFVDALLDGEPNALTEAFRVELFRRTRGHPLFTVELLHDMQERGELHRDEQGRWVQGGAINWEELPVRMEAVISRRISRLPAILQEALKIASVEGDVFTAEVVAHILGMPGWELVQLLSGIAGRQHRLVTAQGPQRLGSQPLSRYRFVHIVFQSYLYGNLDPAERAYLHEEVGNALEELATGRTEAVAGQLAHHFQAAGLRAKALDYLHKAGRQAISQSAHQEAISYLTRALGLLADLPETDERMKQELRLQNDLGISYKITRGFAADEVERVYRRAKILCASVGDSISWARVLWGFHGVYAVRGEMAAGYASAQECLALAKDDPILLVTGHCMAGASLGHMGRLRSAEPHFEQAREAYSPEQHDVYTFLSGFDLGVFTLVHFAHAMGYLGYPEQALRLAQDAVEMARSLAHPFSLVVASSYLALLHQLLGDWRAVETSAHGAHRLCIENDAPYYLAWNSFMLGWVQTVQGRIEQGIAQMEQSMADFQAMQAGLRRPYYLGLLAEAYGRAGRIEHGLHLTEEALAQARRQDQLAYEPDVHRVRGELLHRDGAAAQDIEACLHRAMASARQREAKLPALRAATRLAQLYQEHGRRDAAQRLLGEAVAGFTEGNDMTHLQAARRLLDDLR